MPAVVGGDVLMMVDGEGWKESDKWESDFNALSDNAALMKAIISECESSGESTVRALLVVAVVPECSA